MLKFPVTDYFLLVILLGAAIPVAGLLLFLKMKERNQPGKNFKKSGTTKTTLKKKRKSKHG